MRETEKLASSDTVAGKGARFKEKPVGITVRTQTMRIGNCLGYDSVDISVFCVFVEYDAYLWIDAWILGGTYAHRERQNVPHGRDRCVYMSCCSLPFSLVLA